MCLKDKNSLKSKIIEDTKEIVNILEEGRIKENLLNYEVVRLQGNFNMLLNPLARQLTGMSKEEYIYIIKNYAELMNKYPDTRERALKKIDYVTSVNISKIIALKGCKNCINIVSTKLDVKESDLCKNCQNLLAEHKL